jgi:hypoxanthine-guanine phosphoribosyltransferase
MNGTLFNLSSREIMASSSEIASQIFQDVSLIVMILSGIMLALGIIWFITYLVDEISFKKRLKKYQKEIEQLK